MHSPHAFCAHVRTFVPDFIRYTPNTTISDDDENKDYESDESSAATAATLLDILGEKCAQSVCIIRVLHQNMSDGFTACVTSIFIKHPNVRS